MTVLAEQNQAADLLVTKCTNRRCGHTFLSRNPIFVGGNSRNISVSGTKVPCERCGAWAAQQDWHIDSLGKFQLRELINEIRNFDNIVRLREFQEQVTEAANDEYTSDELADALSELDPRFTKFKSYIRSLSAHELARVIEALVLLLTLVFTISSSFGQREANELTRESNVIQAESVSIQQKQHELDKLKFETEQLNRDTDQKVSELENQIDSILRLIEEVHSNQNAT
ncbi:hypothetical protein [Shewanella sp. 1180_01]|uniref:hypothetical protein n=1 Tax=Shewanella sp. 1180_01 TaxID=2604451 RepID=UPI0040631514